MEKLIIDAIKSMKLLEFNYQGFHRIVEPHTYGVFSNGNELLVAYQISGKSSSRRVPFWSSFLIDDMEDISILDEKFREPRNDYKKGDKRFHQIYCEL